MPLHRDAAGAPRDGCALSHTRWLWRHSRSAAFQPSPAPTNWIRCGGGVSPATDRSCDARCYSFSPRASRNPSHCRGNRLDRPRHLSIGSVSRSADGERQRPLFDAIMRAPPRPVLGVWADRLPGRRQFTSPGHLECRLSVCDASPGQFDTPAQESRWRGHPDDPAAFQADLRRAPVPLPRRTRAPLAALQ
jgi:hypothetical protein